jgi:hypothetical protein
MKQHEKEIQMQFGKFLVFSQLLLETLDDPVKVPTKETKALIDDIRAIEPKLARLNEKFNTDAVRRSTFFTDLQSKILFNFKKAYEL